MYPMTNGMLGDAGEDAGVISTTDQPQKALDALAAVASVAAAPQAAEQTVPAAAAPVSAPASAAMGPDLLRQMLLSARQASLRSLLQLANRACCLEKSVDVCSCSPARVAYHAVLAVTCCSGCSDESSHEGVCFWAKAFAGRDSRELFSCFAANSQRRLVCVCSTAHSSLCLL